ASWFVLRAVTVTGRLLGHWLPSAIFFQRLDWSQTPMVSGFQPSVAWAGVGVMLGMLLAGVRILLASRWVLEHEAELRVKGRLHPCGFHGCVLQGLHCWW